MGQISLFMGIPVQTWIDMRAEDLLANWELAKEGKKPLWVQPLM